tara:strand:+ start:5038 stop:5421 length:384 start_codon:yes stop_codon:yes gene_type:complete
MKVLTEKAIFNCRANHLWEIVSDVSRCDWVPSVNSITIEGDCRIFEMDGMGSVTEKILINDSKSMKFQYSAIKTRTPINHHLATIQIREIDSNNCELEWKQEIDPEIFAEAIHHGIMISIEGLKKVI